MTTIYSASLYQDNNYAPEPTILEWLFPNLEIFFTYLSTGKYKGQCKEKATSDLVDLFDVDVPKRRYLTAGGGSFTIEYTGNDEFEINCFDAGGTQADNVLTKDYFTIELSSNPTL